MILPTGLLYPPIRNYGLCLHRNEEFKQCNAATSILKILRVGDGHGLPSRGWCGSHLCCVVLTSSAATRSSKLRWPLRLQLRIYGELGQLVTRLASFGRAWLAASGPVVGVV